MIDWTQIVRDHGGTVMRVAYRLLGQEADARDCFQKTFLTAVELAGRETIRSWPAVLKRLASLTALQMLRTRIRRRPRNEPLPDGLAATSSGSADPLEVAAGSELAESLRRALGEIDPRQAELFCLVCLEDCTNLEAAGLMGIRANHAGVLLHRAKQALRVKLDAFTPANRRALS
jgi:RNA polymerase sigma-70 factor, ECF subfamily